jgi:peptide/nickel transport system permease protein
MSDIATSAPRPGRLHKLIRSFGLLRESPIGIVGLILVLFWVLIAIFADLLPLRDPLAQSAPDLLKKALSPAPDGGTYWLGTDDKGRDILSRLFYGSRLVLFWSGLATTWRPPRCAASVRSTSCWWNCCPMHADR